MKDFRDSDLAKDLFKALTKARTDGSAISGKDAATLLLGFACHFTRKISDAPGPNKSTEEWLRQELDKHIKEGLYR